MRGLEYIEFEMMTVDKLVEELNKKANKFFKQRDEQAGPLLNLLSFVLVNYLRKDKEQISTWRETLIKDIADLNNRRDATLKEIEEYVQRYLYVHYSRGLSKKEINKIEKTVDDIEYNLDKHLGDAHHPEYLTLYQLDLLLERIELFMGKIIDFNNWSSEDSLSTYADCLQLNASYLKNHGHYVGCEKDYKRCLNIISQLKYIASNNELDYPELEKFHKRHPLKMLRGKPTEIGAIPCTITHESALSEEELNKRTKWYYKKGDEWYKNKVNDAFEFLKKYWNSFTD